MFLENVTELREESGKSHLSDADYIVQWFQEHEYEASYFVVSARDFGSPSHRRRLFFLAVHVGRDSSPQCRQTSLKAAFAEVDTVLKELKVDACPLEQFLIEPDTLQMWAQTSQWPLYNKRENSAGKVLAFKSEHCQLYRAADLTYPLPEESVPTYLKHVLGDCSERMQESLIYLDAIYPLAEHSCEVEGLDLNASLPRLLGKTSPWRMSFLPTLVTTSRILLRWRDRATRLPNYRFMLGLESMECMGFHLGWIKDSDKHMIGHAAFVDMAGNAFNGFALVSFFLAWFCCCPKQIGFTDTEAKVLVVDDSESS